MRMSAKVILAYTHPYTWRQLRVMRGCGGWVRAQWVRDQGERGAGRERSGGGEERGERPLDDSEDHLLEV